MTVAGWATLLDRSETISASSIRALPYWIWGHEDEGRGGEWGVAQSGVGDGVEGLLEGVAVEGVGAGRGRR